MKKCYRVDGPSEESCWCITETPTQALLIAAENIFDDVDPDYPLEAVLLPDDDLLSITDDDTGETEKKRVREWIDTYGNGTGFLCCTCY